MFFFLLTSCLADELHSPVSVNNNVELEPALNPELAEKYARELQESYDTAIRGEGEGGDEDGEGDVGAVVDDDDNADPVGLAGNDLMDVDGPGLFSNIC